MSVPARPLTVGLVLVWDLEHDPIADQDLSDAIESVWVFSSRIVADVWVERRVSQDPTLGYSVFEVELDAGILELPRRDG